MNAQQHAEWEACGLRALLHTTDFQGLIVAAHDQKFDMRPTVRANILKCEKWILDRLEQVVCDEDDV